MQSKSLLIAIAALAVTATGVHAHAGGSYLSRTNLSTEQRAALEEAAQLRAHGDVTAARDVLIEAGIDETALVSMRQAMRASRQALHSAILAGDYDAFKAAVADTPLADLITTEADFTLFREAHELRRAGAEEAAAAVYADLGISRAHHGLGFGHGPGHRHWQKLEGLTDDEREALRVARQSNDRETVHAILRDIGVE